MASVPANPPSELDLDPVRELLDAGEIRTALRQLSDLGRRPCSVADRGRLLALEVVGQRRAGHFREAYRVAREAVRQSGTDHDYLHGAALEFAEMGELVLAEELLREVCELQPEVHLPVFHLATVLDRDGRLEEANKLYSEAIELDPSYAPNYNHLAACLRDLDQPAAAIVAYRHYLKLVPSDAYEWVSLALVLSDREQYEDAYAAFTQARDLDPRAPSTSYNWAITAVQRQDRCTLTRCVAALEEHTPADWRAAATRALLHEYDGDLQGGWLAARRAVELADGRGREHEEDLLGAISACLRYASRHHFAALATDLLARCFAEELFDDDVLDAIRLLQDRWSDSAGDYEVALEFAVPPSVAASVPEPPGEDLDECRFVRHYQVFADTREEAVRLASTFEERCGATDIELLEVEELKRGFEACLGIAFRSSGYLLYPDDGEAEDDRDLGPDDDAPEPGPDEQDHGFFFPRF